jgi:spore coat protein U-like protein
MKRVVRLTAAVALLALALSPGFARAQVNTSVATMPVQASVQSGCLVSTGGVNFGAVSPLIIEEDQVSGGKEIFPYLASGIIFLACGSFGPTSGTFVAVAMDTGANGAIAPILGIGTNVTAIRAMTNGTSFLLYDCFKPLIDPVTGSLETCSGTGAESTPSGPEGLFGGGEWGDGADGGASAFTFTPVVYDNCVKKGLEINGTTSSIPGGGGTSICTVPVCCAIPGDQVQALTPGIYTDTIAVTIHF